MSRLTLATSLPKSTKTLTSFSFISKAQLDWPQLAFLMINLIILSASSCIKPLSPKAFQNHTWPSERTTCWFSEETLPITASWPTRQTSRIWPTQSASTIPIMASTRAYFTLKKESTRLLDSTALLLNHQRPSKLSYSTHGTAHHFCRPGTTRASSTPSTFRPIRANQRHKTSLTLTFSRLTGAIATARTTFRCQTFHLSFQKRCLQSHLNSTWCCHFSGIMGLLTCRTTMMWENKPRVPSVCWHWQALQIFPMSLTKTSIRRC